jgi:hypothetical protein
MKKEKITVTMLAVEYLKEVFKLSNDDAHHAWNYHCRLHPYAKRARNEDWLKTKILGLNHRDLVNISAYSWMKINVPDHPFLEEFEKWQDQRG